MPDPSQAPTPGEEHARTRDGAEPALDRASGYRGSGHPGHTLDRNPGALDRLPAPRHPDHWRQRLSGLAWGAAWDAARVLPESVAFGLARVAATAGARLARSTRDRVRANLARVVAPEALEATVDQAFQSYARYWIEAFRAADVAPDTIDERMTTSGFQEHLDGALDHGRGVVVLLAHHGSWDIAARWAETHGYHAAVVAEVVRPRRLFARFVRLREAIGIEIVPLTRHATIGNGSVAGRLGEVLRANHMVGLLSDRDLTGRAPQVEFFGERCPLPLGAAVLAQRHGSPIVPVATLQRPGRRWHLRAFPALWLADASLSEAQRVIAAALERVIRLDPAQWHAFQPVWPDRDAS